MTEPGEQPVPPTLGRAATGPDQIPILVGGAWFYQAWKRRYRVAWFRGNCPRCFSELTIPPDSWVAFPYRIDCMTCHFDPEVELEKQCA